MGMFVPQVITPSKATGAQVIDGSLRFDDDFKTSLSRSVSTAGNRRTWTFSCWIKKSKLYSGSTYQNIFSSLNTGTIQFDSIDQLRIYDNAGGATREANSVSMRDTNGWYHIVVKFDTTQATDTNRVFIYLNGEDISKKTGSWPSQNYESPFNAAQTHYLGTSSDSNNYLPGLLSQVYLIDGQALGPEYFGFTDPLTNTWKPKKYTGTFTGTNTFYLPFDGNSPIGQDQSGNGNDWTPQNFNGSVPLDSDIITGGRPILNTTQGGAQAGVGVFGALENKYYTVSSSSGGGNPYIFDNEGTQPTFNFIRGVTYTFNYSAATSHPLRFATAADAAGSSQYTTGTNISGNSIKITVPHDAPDTLYYYCTNHSGMGNSISVTTDETKADKYASNIVLAVPLVGGSYDFSGCLNCNTGSKVATNSNGPSYVTTLSNFYTGSGDFTGSSTQKRIDYATSGGAFGFGTDDFTIEWWMHATTNADGNHYVWDTTGQRSSLIRKSGGGMTFETYGSSGGIGEVTILSSGSYSLNKWAHWAVVRDGDTVYVYIDGVLKQKTTGFSGVDFGNVDGHIGGYNGGGAGYNPDAHLQDFRIYKGVAKYSGTTVGTQYFTVPSRSPDILPDTPSGVSGGSKLTKVTDGAVYFDGTGDYLEISDNADFEMGTDDFTIEAFVYNQEDAVQSMITKYGDGNSTSSFWLGTLTSSRPSFYWYNGSNSYSINGAVGSLPLNKWCHVVAQRKSGDMYLFVDGKRVSGNTGSNAALSLNDVSEPVVIGSDSYSGGEQPFQGYISNVRIVKGTGVYDVTEDTTLGKQNFIPPTAPLTNVTNTKLLCCQDITEFKNGAQPILNTNATGTTTSSGTRVDPYASSLVLAIPFNGSNGGTTFTDQHATIKGSGSAKSISVSGNTQTSTTKSQYYGSSGYFDGSGDYLTISDSADFAFGSGNFTIEAWVYLTDLSASNTISSQNGSGGSSYGHFLEVLSDGRINGGGYNPGDNYINVTTNTSDALVVNRWYHIAMVRNGNDLNLHIDGVIKKTTNVSGKSFTDSSSNLTIGKQGSYDYYLFGYIQDYRIYKGVAKYTSSFNVTAPIVEPVSAVSPNSIVAAGNAAATNFNPFNTDINTVRGQETGYCTLNPIFRGATQATYSDGNLSCNTGNANGHVRGNIGITTGKHYFEVVSQDTGLTVGIVQELSIPEYNIGGDNKGYGYLTDGTKANAGWVSYGDSWGAGDVIGVAFNATNGELSFYKNGVSQGVAFTNLFSNPYFPAVSDTSSNQSKDFDINFGQKPFKFVPPDGFQPLNTANTRPVKVISRPDQYVGVTTYTGSNGTNHIIRSGIDADLVWIKNRDNSFDHNLFDTIRVSDGSGGDVAGSSRPLYPNRGDLAQGNLGEVSLLHDGFNLHAADSAYNAADDYVAWSWKAGGKKNTFNVDDVGYASAAAAGLGASGNSWNSDPTGASIGTKQGFSIIKHTGTGSTGTLPHGLTQKPTFYISKPVSTSGNWVVYTDVIDGSLDYFYLNTNGTKGDSGQSLPTSELFSYGYTANEYIHYLWHDVPGLQKFGKYTGNNSSDGPYVELGFRPAVVWIKGADFAANWFVFDNKREFDYNPTDEWFNLDTSSSANAGGGIGGGTAVPIDFLSNGFKVRFGTAGYINNTSSYNFIYCAWAEAPSVDLYGGGANAR